MDNNYQNPLNQYPKNNNPQQYGQQVNNGYNYPVQNIPGGRSGYNNPGYYNNPNPYSNPHPYNNPNFYTNPNPNTYNRPYGMQPVDTSVDVLAVLSLISASISLLSLFVFFALEDASGIFFWATAICSVFGIILGAIAKSKNKNRVKTQKTIANIGFILSIVMLCIFIALIFLSLAVVTAFFALVFSA